MRKTSLLLLTLFIAFCVHAQVPQALNYQAIARNSSGQSLPGQPISVRFSITDATGATVFYKETHSTVTNNFGLFTLAIGKGTAVSGAIAPIDWSAGGDKMLKVEIDPQGGTNYTMQGSTQLISVPYALYAEKTKLVAGNAITITNGNTISGNYIAGPGITITGNTISATATNNSWLLTGNAGTTAANFVGTTDDQRLNFRTNNLTRMYIDNSHSGFGNDVSSVYISDEANIGTRPGQLDIFGKDIAGLSIPLAVINSTVGATWGTAGGNTSGRLVRLAQMRAASFSQALFYDLGIGQDSSLYLSGIGFQNVGGLSPKPIITISAQNLLGINMNWAEKPTANFHTKGTARFEGITANNSLTRVMVMDNNGNVSSRDASTFGGGGGNAWQLLGNSGTDLSANFLGTTDNQGLSFRTNNITRMHLDNPINAFGANLSQFYLSDEASVQNYPAQLSVYGRDIAGANMPAFIVSYVSGATWGINAGNTLGRLVRLSQMTSANISQSHYYDIGIGQDSSLFFTNHGFQSVGGIFPKQMITISAQDNVGINMAWAQKPTANFHAKGTARFEGITTNNALTRVMVMDNNGNVSSRDASTLAGGSSNDWSLTGNAGTTAANFLGTTDDQRLNFRTNNLTRMYIDKTYSGFGHDISAVYISDEGSIQTRPGLLNIFGKDLAGLSIPLAVIGSVQGGTWGTAGGNTSGRLVRFSQMRTASFSQSYFYDAGIQQDSSWYLSGMGLQNVGGLLPKPMITISAQNNLGVNMNWAQKPTANFHTKGTARFEGLTTNNTLTRLMVMDINGNVSSRDASSLTASSYWLPDANGIHYSAGSVGIGTNSLSNTPFAIMGTASSVYTAEINSVNTWQTAINLYNSTSNWRWAITTGGSLNNMTTYGVGEGNFGIANDNNNSLNTTFPIMISKDDKVGIGMGLGGTNSVPKAQLHVKTGDVYLEQIGSGVIMKSPNGQCWRMTVSNTGTPVFTAIACP